MRKIVLGAEFCALSNSATFNLDHRPENAQNPEEILLFFEIFEKYLLTRFAIFTLLILRKACAEFRIKFYID
jgi:hypothetical protein